MSEIVSTIFLFAAVLLYPVVSGPVAARVLVVILKREGRGLRLFFWPALIAVHVAGYFFMLHTLGDVIFGPGFLACLITPIFAVGTALGLRLSSRRFYRAIGDDASRRRWFVIGTVLIPLMQLVTIGVLILLAPSR
jgi:hypothetical protein